MRRSGRRSVLAGCLAPAALPPDQLAHARWSDGAILRRGLSADAARLAALRQGAADLTGAVAVLAPRPAGDAA